MKTRIFFIGTISILGLFVALGALATSKGDIAYPIAELGNCESEQECRSYCDEVRHIKECVAFAQKHNLLSAQELAHAKRFAQFGVESGPGGCTREVACKAYCENVSNIEECLAFAEQHSVLDRRELSEAKRVAAALRSGAQLPGDCQSKRACEVYCAVSSHIEECLNFAEAAGFIDAEELAEARRVAPFMARGEMPGGCTSRQECEAYCSQESHVEECASFFERAGFITAEEAAMFRKTGGRGPGGCQGREECETYCNEPAHQQACFAFAKEHGILPSEEIHNIEEGLAQFRQGLQHATPEIARCLKDTIGEQVLSKIEEGTFMPNRTVGEHMRQCFENHAGSIIEHQIRESMGEVPSGAVECIQRIVGSAAGATTPEQEQKIRAECFPREEREEFLPSNSETSPEFHEEFQRQYEEEYQRQLQQRTQEEIQRQIEQQTSEPAPENTFPETRSSRQGFFGAVIDSMTPALKRWFPFLSF